MKKIIVTVLFMFCALTFINAQKAPSKSETTKEAKKKADVDAKMKTKSTGLNKNGTPDMRMKTNKQTKLQPPVTQPTPITKTQPTPVTKTQPITPVTKTQSVPVNRVNTNTSEIGRASCRERVYSSV